MEQLERTLPRLLRHCTMHSRQWNEDVIIKELQDGHNGHRARVPLGRPLFKVTVHNSFWMVKQLWKSQKEVQCRLHGDKKQKRRYKSDYRNPQKIDEDNLNDRKQTQDWLQRDANWYRGTKCISITGNNFVPGESCSHVGGVLVVSHALPRAHCLVILPWMSCFCHGNKPAVQITRPVTLVWRVMWYWSPFAIP